jgi:hypothetical protein
MHYLCPVAPFGMQLPMLLVRQNLRGDDQMPDVTLRWLQEVTGHPELGAPLATLQSTKLWRDTHATLPVQPHALPGIAVALQVCLLELVSYSLSVTSPFKAYVGAVAVLLLEAALLLEPVPLIEAVPLIVLSMSR